MEANFPGLGLISRGYYYPWQEEVKKIANNNKKTLIETFSGPGGMSLGLEWAGFDLKLAFDYDKMSVETHNKNLGNKCLQLDARDVSGNFILNKTKLKGGDIDLVSGGPPCQGFSKQKRGAHLGDSRNELVDEYIRIIRELNPRFFLFENVAIFGQKRGKKHIENMLSYFNDYDLNPAFYNAANYGLPQTRQRYIIVGKRKDIKTAYEIPLPTVDKWLTIADVFKDLPEPPEDYTEHSKYPNHQRAKVTGLNIHRFRFVPQGGGWQDIPIELRLKCHRVADTKSGGWPDVYGRLEWNGQCPTITGGFDSFTRGRYGHPFHDRPITPREAARIQGFPDSFIFLGTRGDIRSQIGNVVPPPLAEAIGLSILRTLFIEDGLINKATERLVV